MCIDIITGFAVFGCCDRLGVSRDWQITWMVLSQHTCGSQPYIGVTKTFIISEIAYATYRVLNSVDYKSSSSSSQTEEEDFHWNSQNAHSITSELFAQLHGTEVALV